MQGDLFKGTEYERGEDLDPTKIYRTEIGKLDLSTPITIQLKDSAAGEIITMRINPDSIDEIRKALTKIKQNWA